MGINWAAIEEELGKESGSLSGYSLTAGQAAVPAYLSSQGKAIEAYGDIAGIDTPNVSEFARQQEAEFGKFQEQYPGSILDTDSPGKWWEEKATVNSLNQIVPYLGYTTSAILQALPYAPAKLLGKVIGTGTFASQYNSNYTDTLQEHTERAGRELTDAEKAWVGVVSGGVVALDRLVPAKLGKDTVKKFGGVGGLKASREQIIKRLRTARQSLGKSLREGGAYAGKRFSQEAATEAAQKALQIGTSQDPGYLFTPEGGKSIVDEAAIAGPTAGILSTPQSILAGTAHNRDIARARGEANTFNKIQQTIAKDLYDSTGIKTSDYNPKNDQVKNWIDIPESAESNLTRLSNWTEKKTNVNPIESIKDIAKVAAFKAPSSLLEARDAQKTGKGYSLWDNIIKKMMPVGSFSGESGDVKDFTQRKDYWHSVFYKDISDILDRLAPSKPGQLTQPKIKKELNDYIRGYLDGKIKGRRPDLIPNKDMDTIRAKLDEVGQKLKTEADAGFINNYLHKPVSAESVKANRGGFIKSLLASSKIAYDRSTKEDKSNFIYQEDETKALENATRIAAEIAQGRDPLVQTSRYIRQLRKDKKSGRPRESFEKARSLEWANLDDSFREQDISVVLEQYLSKAATRVTSIEAFGVDGKGLHKQLRELKKLGATQDQVNKTWDIYDALHNVYRRDVSEQEDRWRGVSKGLTTVAAVTHLGLATLSSLSEVVWIGERAGLRSMFKTLPSAFKYTLQGIRRGTTGKHLGRSEGNKVLANLGFNLNPMMNERLDQLFSADRNAMLSMYFRSPFGMFLTQWTNFNRNWAAQAGMATMNRRAKGLVNGSIDPMDKRRLLNELKENGISLNEFKQLADLSKDDKGNININMVDDAYLSKDFIREDGTKTRVKDVIHPWVHKLVTEVIVHPTATNKPLWMSDPTLSAIAQLKSFPIVFGNTVVKRLYRKLKPSACSADFGLAMSAIASIAAAMAVAQIGEEIKAAIKGQESEATWIDIGNTAGLFGAGGILIGSKYGDLTSSVLGPSLDALVNKGFGDIIAPVTRGENDMTDIPVDLGEWLISGVKGALGASGHLMFGEDE